MQNSKHPKVRQFLDRVPEPAVAQELDYLQMLTEPSSKLGEGRQGKSR
jgi:phospholipid/cholesterol/gamma-HCH transport system ATP-binding protein